VEVLQHLLGMPGGSTNGVGSAARFSSPFGITIDSLGNLFVGEYGNLVIRKITPSGSVTTFAGTTGLYGSTDGVGSSARFLNPKGVTFDMFGNLFVMDHNNFIVRKIFPDGTVITIAGMRHIYRIDCPSSNKDC
jgi:hypothetical protein